MYNKAIGKLASPHAPCSDLHVAEQPCRREQLAEHRGAKVGHVAEHGQHEACGNTKGGACTGPAKRGSGWEPISDTALPCSNACAHLPP